MNGGTSAARNERSQATWFFSLPFAWWAWRARDHQYRCAGRHGGEECLLVMPGTSANVAFNRAEHLRRKCAVIRIQQEDMEIRITLSVGVATFPTHSSGPEDILIQADKALYRSKRTGRKRVMIWNGS